MRCPKLLVLDYKQLLGDLFEPCSINDNSGTAKKLKEITEMGKDVKPTLNSSAKHLTYAAENSTIPKFCNFLTEAIPR